MFNLQTLLFSIALLLTHSNQLSNAHLTTTPAFSLPFYQLQQQQQQQQQQPALLTLQSQSHIPNQVIPVTTDTTFHPHHFPQLISHSTQLSGNRTTFSQRFWFDPSYYQPGGPVIVLDGGETSGEDRLPFLQTGILAILAKATNGLPIILEHRYYGKSFPFEDLSTDSLQYLNTRESLDDSAYFARHLVLPGYEHFNITAPHTPWIYYGGSYAGAKAAFMIHLYPDLIWGSLASSAVVHAQINFWQYYEPIRRSAPHRCIEPLITITRTIDRIFGSGNLQAILGLKEAFGLGNVTDNRDFVNVLASPLGNWQARNWDPQLGSDPFEPYCSSLSDRPAVLPTSLSSLLPFLTDDFPLGSFLSYARYIKTTISSTCQKDDQDECFGLGNEKDYRAYGLDQTWRAWTWQVCTEWGYFADSTPGDRPSLISKLIDLPYSSRICRLAFGDAVPSKPNVTAINQYGGFKLSAARLVYIDGSDDPWLYATPHSPHHKYKHTHQKAWLIKGGVHHWDENGSDHEPEEIQRVHAAEVKWVTHWLKEFHRQD